MVDFKRLMKERGIEPKSKPRPFCTLYGVLFNCTNGLARAVQCGVFIEEKKDSKWVILEGGVTGYESFSFEGRGKGDLEAMRQGGWHACTGTDGRWDTLYFHKLQMQKLLNKLAEREAKR